MDSHGLESGAEGEVTLVDGGPAWRRSNPGLRVAEPDTQVDLRAVASYEDDWDSVTADAQLRSADVTDVDLPALPPVSESTLPDQPLLADEATEEADPTLDTPTLMVPYLVPARPAAQAANVPATARRTAALPSAAGRPAERLPEAPALAQPITPSIAAAHSRPMPTPRTPRSTPGSGSKRLTRRSDREALARVIAMAKPRTSATRAQPAPRPARTR